MKRTAALLGLAVLAAVVAPAAEGVAAVSYVRSTVELATASSHDGNLPRNTLDSNRDTRWSANGDGQWLRLDLAGARQIGLVKLAFFRGAERRAQFDLQVSSDNSSWRTVWSGQSSGTTTGLETFDFADTSARYVRYLGHGNTSNTWNSLTEAEVHVVAGTSQRVSVGGDGRLVYPPYSNGDRIPDFSRAGYRGGGVALPAVPVRRTVSPVSGDDRASIQSAIDAVSGLTPDASGFRGAVLLRAGTYEVSSSLTIRTSGVVLRGEGDGAGGTVLRATGTSVRTLINVTGSGSRSEVSGSRKAVTSSYVPVGARTLTVSDGSGFRVGDSVVVVRTPNQSWIDAVGMDSCTTKGTSYDTSDVSGVTCLSETVWTPSSRTIHYERTITAVNGNQLTIDSPVVNPMQSQFGGGAVYKYTFGGRISNVGVEHLRADSAYTSSTDEAHANWAVRFAAARNGWVRNVTSRYFTQGTFHGQGGASFITVADSASTDHRSQITGGRRYPFSLDGASHVLLMRLYASSGRHDFATGSNTPGPNVFLDSRAEDSRSEMGPHHRWGTGTLFDNVVHNSAGGNQILGTYNRGNSGTGHGWSGAYQVFYNCLGDKHRVSSPPYARNWSIGCRSTVREGTGEFDAYGGPVGPWSLYLHQLRDRLGESALRNIGY
ncbi:MAG: discoidin domain-containing protein [Micromonosporaceae bacterium]